MFYPDFKEFEQKALEGNLIPVYREILADLETPVSAYLKTAEGPSFLLESVVGGKKWARYSFIGTNPSMIIRVSGNDVESIENGKKTKESFDRDPLEVIKKILNNYRAVKIHDLPRFFGGFVGYIGYYLHCPYLWCTRDGACWKTCP